ncbi:hypothetical protein [Roseateles sp.]|uniref:hypothetical protein n=1 Tax=Roseateles sp. TaxID=1971397 RepID=UPI0031D06047
MKQPIFQPPILPARFISPEFDLCLFFDFSLRSAGEFFNELKEALPEGESASVFNSRDLSALGTLRKDEDWAGKIALIEKALDQEGEYHSLSVVGQSGGWLIAQEIPVSWGLFAFKKESSVGKRLFEVFENDGFIRRRDVEEAIGGSRPSLVNDVGLDFLRYLMLNYGSS